MWWDANDYPHHFEDSQSSESGDETSKTICILERYRFLPDADTRISISLPDGVILMQLPSNSQWNRGLFVIENTVDEVFPHIPRPSLCHSVSCQSIRLKSSVCSSEGVSWQERAKWRQQLINVLFQGWWFYKCMDGCIKGITASVQRGWPDTNRTTVIGLIRSK